MPNFVSSTGGSFETKAGDGWKEVLSKVAEAHPTSTVGKRYGKRSMKDIKTRDIVKKYVEKAVKHVKLFSIFDCTYLGNALHCLIM